MNDFKEFLELRLKHPLPGKEAQNIMQPLPSKSPTSKLNYAPQTSDFRNSSVLVPIIAWNGQMEVVFTLRTEGIKHGGQISFPGGGKEGDESIETTALREAREEIGLVEDSVNVVGVLTPLYINHSGNMVVPVVGFIEQEQKFVPNPNEVEEIFTIPLSDLIEQKNHIREEWNLRNIQYNVPFWDLHRVPLWGATAMILSEFIELYKEFISQSKS